MVSSSAKNVGIVGLGWPGERHAEAISVSSLGTVYSACDLNTERLNAFAATFGPRHTSQSAMRIESKSGAGAFAFVMVIVLLPELSGNSTVTAPTLVKSWGATVSDKTGNPSIGGSVVVG
jgi:hypothetical protein